MKYFTLNELIYSSTAASKGINNNPSAGEVMNLKKLIDNVLDPLREEFGRPIRVNSGYRSYALNKAVNGVKTSDHLKGMAADITGGSRTENVRLFNIARDLKLPYRQLIDEKGFRWIHISYNENDIKRQELHLK